MSKNDYNASNITVLKGLEAVRLRPGMYIGPTNDVGLHHMIWEIVDNSVDEYLAGHATKIEISLNADGSITVKDNGRGIPVDIHPEEKVSALQLAATVLHAGGKFNSDSYKVSSGLHGVGLSVVNALSKKTKIQVFKNGNEYLQEYEKGIPQYPVKELGKTGVAEKGTWVTFLPDETIFETVEFKFKQILKKARQHAYLNGGLTLKLSDFYTNKKPFFYTFHFEGGIKSYMRNLNAGLKTIHKNVFYVHENVEEVDVEIALQYTDDIQSRESFFGNNVNNKDGGTHATGFRMAVTKAINDTLPNFVKEKEKDTKLSGDDVREGLTAIVAVKVINPIFENQTKTKLNNPEVTQIVRKIMEDAFKTFLSEHPDDAKAIIDRSMLAKRARDAAKAAREAVVRKSILDSGGLPGKLADCNSRNPEECELCIVEGESAGGSAKTGRNREIQAIFPLKGKPINSEKYRIDKVLENKEITDLIRALGAGIGESMDVSKLKYHKVIIMADADVDGQHIRTLMLTFFYRHLRPIVEGGYLYLAQPPLYRVIFGVDEVVWATDEKHRDKIIADKPGRKYKISRFKGLGEMNPEELWETTMDPKVRVIKQVTVDDATEADKMFDVLMGEEVAPRKRYIQTHSKSAELDV